MAAVDNTNQNTNPLSLVVSILNNSSYIKDPKFARGTRRRKFIYRSLPEVTSFDFGLYPVIVVKPNQKNPVKTSADQTTREIVWTYEMTLLTVKNGSGNNVDDLGVDDMLAMQDDIDRYFDSNAVRTDFKENGLNYRQIQQLSSMDEIVVGNQTILQSIYQFTFRSRLCTRP